MASAIEVADIPLVKDYAIAFDTAGPNQVKVIEVRGTISVEEQEGDLPFKTQWEGTVNNRSDVASFSGLILSFSVDGVQRDKTLLGNLGLEQELTTGPIVVEAAVKPTTAGIHLFFSGQGFTGAGHTENIFLAIPDYYDVLVSQEPLSPGTYNISTSMVNPNPTGAVEVKDLSLETSLISLPDFEGSYLTNSPGWYISTVPLRLTEDGVGSSTFTLEPGASRNLLAQNILLPSVDADSPLDPPMAYGVFVSYQTGDEDIFDLIGAVLVLRPLPEIPDPPVAVPIIPIPPPPPPPPITLPSPAPQPGPDIPDAPSFSLAKPPEPVQYTYDITTETNPDWTAWEGNRATALSAYLAASAKWKVANDAVVTASQPSWKPGGGRSASWIAHLAGIAGDINTNEVIPAWNTLQAANAGQPPKTITIETPVLNDNYPSEVAAMNDWQAKYDAFRILYDAWSARYR